MFMSKEDLEKWAPARRVETMQKQWVKESTEAGLKTASSIMAKMKALHKQATDREK